MGSIEILIQACPSFSPHIHLYCLGRSLRTGTYRERYYLINKCVPGEYLSLFFGAMISLDAKRDGQSR